MDNLPPEQSDTVDDIFVKEETKSEASTDLSETDEKNIEGAAGGAINKDGQPHQINAQNTTQQTYDNDGDGDSQITSDEGKVIEGAVGGVTVSCDQCETETAIMYCQNCPGYLCKICHDAHKKSKLTRNHSYINMSPHMLSASLYVQNDENEDKESCKITCNAHPAKLAGSICNTCAFPICSDCEPNHKEHDSVYLKQENMRQLQVICTDDSQLLLKLIVKLESLQKITSSEGLYTEAIACMATAKQRIEKLIQGGGKHTLVVENLSKEKRDVIEKHDNKLENIANTLDEATFVVSKLQFAGTTKDMNIVMEALYYFYVHYKTLITKHAHLVERKYEQPDTAQLDNMSVHMISLEQAFNCYKNPCTRYDRLNQLLCQRFTTITDFIATSPSRFLWTSETCKMGYFDTISDNMSGETLTETVFRLALVTDTRIVGLGSKSYIVFDKDMKRRSAFTKKVNHKASATWDSNNILVLDSSKKLSQVFLLDISSKMPQSTLLFETTSITNVDMCDAFSMSRNASKEIIIIRNHSFKLYKFDQTGKLLLSHDLPFTSVVSSFYVDIDDNLVIGCANGQVYFVDCKTNKWKLLRSLWGPVMRIGEIDGLLYTFVCSSNPGEYPSQGSLYTFEIEPSGESKS